MRVIIGLILLLIVLTGCGTVPPAPSPLPLVGYSLEFQAAAGEELDAIGCADLEHPERCKAPRLVIMIVDYGKLRNAIRAQTGELRGAVQ